MGETSRDLFTEMWLIARPMDDVGILLNPNVGRVTSPDCVRAAVRRKAEAKWIRTKCYKQAVGLPALYLARRSGQGVPPGEAPEQD